MKTLRNRLIALLTTFSLALLTACGGGGGSDTVGGNTPPTGGNIQTVTKSFTVSLANVKVSRISNGDTVEVETAEITSSGSITISQ